MEQRLVAYQYGAEKHRLYLNHYERHFQHFAEHHINLLELGIYYCNGETSFETVKSLAWIWTRLP